MGTPLTTRIPIKDARGNVIEEKEVATYAGLLALAHEEGLTAVATALVQIPTKENGQTAIATALVETSKGRFAGIGDATPENVNRKIVPHLIRMAETRAKARALRDAVNVGLVSLEELGEMDASEVEHERRENGRGDHGRGERSRPERERPLPTRSSGSSGRNADRLTDPQRRLLYRLLAEQGFEGQTATGVLCDEAGVSDVNEITKHQASKLIEAWQSRGNGHGASA